MKCRLKCYGSTTGSKPIREGSIPSTCVYASKEHCFLFAPDAKVEIVKEGNLDR